MQDTFRQVTALHSDHYRLVPLVGGGCFRQVAALHSDHYRLVPLVGAGCCRQVAALHSDHYRHVYYTIDIEVMEFLSDLHVHLHNSQNMKSTH